MLRPVRPFILLAGLLIAAVSAVAAEKISVLVVTGGHGFTREPFFRIFRENPAIEFTTAAHARDADAYERPEFAAADVVVLYDMPKTVTATQRAQFSARLARGGGLFVLHHALCSFPDWPDYERLIGGRYPVAGEGSAQAGYRHDVDIPVVIAARDHPITAGLKNFTVRDEIYWGFRLGADATPLLKTTHPDSGNPLAWVRQEGAARIVYLQLGHGLPCYDDPNYRELVARCLRWAARR